MSSSSFFAHKKQKKTKKQKKIVFQLKIVSIPRRFPGDAHVRIGDERHTYRSRVHRTLLSALISTNKIKTECNKEKQNTK